MDDLEFVMQMTDRLTGPASAMGRALAALQMQLKKTGNEASSVSKGSGSSGFGGLMTAMNQTVQLAGQVTDALMGIGKVVLSGAGFAVAVGSYKSSLQMQMGMMLKLTEDESKKVVGEINKIAATTPFETRDVADAIKKFIGAGFTKSEAFEMLNTVGDIAAFNDFDTEIIKRMTMVISQVKGKGRLMGDDMLQMIEASGGAISPAKLAKQLGMDPLTFQKAMEGGKLSAEKVLPAIQALIKDGISGGSSGGLMKKMSQEIPGLLSTLKDVPFMLIPSIDDSTGLSSFREFLRKVAKLFDGEGGNMARLQEAVSKLIDAVFSGFGGLDDLTLASVLESVIVGIEDLAATIAEMDLANTFKVAAESAGVLVRAVAAFSSGALSGLGATLGPIFEGMSSAGANAETWRMIGKAIGYVVGGLVWLAVRLGESFTWFYKIAAVVWEFVDSVLGLSSAFSALGGFFDPILDSLAGMYDAAVGIAGDFIDGLVQGILNGATAVIDAVSGLGGSMITSAEEALGIASPSKAGQEIGANYGGSVAMGAEGELDNVQGAMASLVAPKAIGGDVGGKTAGGGTTITNYFTITVAAGATVDGATIDAMKSGVGQGIAEAYGDS